MKKLLMAGVALVALGSATPHAWIERSFTPAECVRDQNSDACCLALFTQRLYRAESQYEYELLVAQMPGTCHRGTPAEQAAV